MKAHVVDHEPGQALFVTDEKPLVFYERILELSKKVLKPGGAVYLEINERFGNEIKQLFEKQFSQVELLKDMQNKDRFIIARSTKKDEDY